MSRSSTVDSRPDGLLVDRAAFLRLRDAVGHPFGRGCPLQVVIEELLHSDLKVLLVFLSRDGLFFEFGHRVRKEELDQRLIGNIGF